jgi:hypothetical protein
MVKVQIINRLTNIAIGEMVIFLILDTPP